MADIKSVSQVYPFRVTRHYLSLIEQTDPFCAIGRQSIPALEELDDTGDPDPLAEGEYSPTPTFIKKFPGRGVFLVSGECAMYCRFCNRRRLVGKGWNPKSFWEETLKYLERNREIREVILSGGDPFMLDPEELSYILSRLKGMGKAVVRVSTRMPVVNPGGMKDGHYRAIEENSPLWVVIHINHPRELSPEFAEAVARIRRAGSMLVSQTVLLRNVNDCPHVLGTLFEGLVSHGVKPYYLFQLDHVKGAGHFKVKLERGIEIMRALRGIISGLAMPQYSVDIPGGLGKVPVDYQYMGRKEGDTIHVESPSAGSGMYVDDGMESLCMKCGTCIPRGVSESCSV
jgi:lysine 2,3-aminomutase